MKGGTGGAGGEPDGEATLSWIVGGVGGNRRGDVDVADTRPLP